MENPLEPEPAASPGPIGTPAKTPSPQDVIPDELEGARTISIPATDGVRIVGTLFGDDEDRTNGVVFVHRDGASKGDWYPLAIELMDRGYAALAIDLRGHGQSEGERDPRSYPIDVSAALDVLYLVGVDRAAVVGTEAGGTAAVAAVDRWRPPENGSIVRGVVTIESEPTFESLDATKSARAIRVPALVLDDDDSELADLIDDAAFERSTQEPDRASSGRLVDAILAFLSEHIEG